MSYYIKKPSLVDGNITVFYIGNNTWCDDESKKLFFETENEALDAMESSGKNGGWSKAVIVKE